MSRQFLPVLLSTFTQCSVQCTAVTDGIWQFTHQMVLQGMDARGENIILCAERGLLTNLEDTIPGPVNSIGALEMYILEKC